MEEELFKCLENDDIEGLKKVINHGVNVNIILENQYTPLLIALANNNYDMVKLLLDNGANIYFMTNFNYIDIAEALCDNEIIDLLKYTVKMQKNKVLIKEFLGTYYNDDVREVKSVICGTDGYIIVGGSYEQHFDIHDRIIKQNERAFIEKVDFNGFSKWKYSTLGKCFNSVIEHNGKYVAVGGYRRDAYGSPNIRNAIIAKFSLKGKVIWKKMTDETIEVIYNIIEVDDGYIVLGIGNFNDDKELGNRFFIAKYDFADNVIWIKDYNMHPRIDVVKKVKDGYILIARFGQDAGLIKCNFDWNILWCKEYENHYNINNHGSSFRSLIETNDGYIVAGCKEITKSNKWGKKYIFAPRYGTIIKFDFDGNILWDKYYDERDSSFDAIIKLKNKFLVYFFNSDVFKHLMISYDFDGNIIESKEINFICNRNAFD